MAGGTFALALATAWMAWHVRGQSTETRRLADTAERQLEATTTPVVRVMRIEDPAEVDIVTVNENAADETLTVNFENRGPTAAGFEQATMTPGGRGEFANLGPLVSPVIEPNDTLAVDFEPSVADKGHHARGHEVLVQIIYEAIGSGARYRRRTFVQRDLKAEHERWLVLREEPPVRL